MDADSGQTTARRVTPLGVVGVALTVLVAIDVLALLWGLTIGSDTFWWLVATFFGGVALVVAWIVYLAAWERRRKRFAWHLVIIPAIGLFGIAAAVTGLPQKARWSYDEPCLTAAAHATLADPRAEFHEYGRRRIGSQEVYGTGKVDGVVTFSVFGGGFSVMTLEYRPDGSTPEFGGEVRGERLSEDWWLVLID